LNIKNYFAFIKRLLNEDLDIDFNDTDSLAANRDRQLVITFDSRGQAYRYPNEDDSRFINFPSDKFVFSKILALPNLPCTATLQTLLRNAQYYDKFDEELNTNSVSQCFLDNFCPELEYCKCIAENTLTCEGFQDFETLDFSVLRPDSLLRTETIRIDLKPDSPREVLDDNLKMGPIRMADNGQIIIRNVNSFDYNDNPFNGISAKKDLNLLIYSSVMRTNEPACSPDLLAPDNIGMFSEFDTILLRDDVIYTNKYDLYLIS
jgi:hypothetical protein